MPDDDQLASTFRDALRPLLRRLTLERTLSLSKTGMLSRLDEQGPATASELAAAEQVSAQAAAVALRELEDRGFVSRTSDPDDRRRVRVSLTDAGRNRLQEERARGTRWLDGALRDRLDDADRAALEAVVPVLRKLTGAGVDE
ncbi:hypothetical protein GCM10010988_28980 [Cnuibacter physcomitrellae]|nr:MarR family transcriptional regulator [Cnuibacter physcomitrellae]GGI40418.1 hypothetical protein GCM10010988_28980 [Cnuibacter physcomitrellae]